MIVHVSPFCVQPELTSVFLGHFYCVRVVPTALSNSHDQQLPAGVTNLGSVVIQRQPLPHHLFQAAGDVEIVSRIFLYLIQFLGLNAEVFTNHSPVMLNRRERP